MNIHIITKCFLSIPMHKGLFFLNVGISICVTSYVECHSWEIKHSHGLLRCNLQISPLTVISSTRSILFPTVSFQLMT